MCDAFIPSPPPPLPLSLPLSPPLSRSSDTLLGATGHPGELFLVDECDDNPLGSIMRKVSVSPCQSQHCVWSDSHAHMITSNTTSPLTPAPDVRCTGRLPQRTGHCWEELRKRPCLKQMRRISSAKSGMTRTTYGLWTHRTTVFPRASRGWSVLSSVPAATNVMNKRRSGPSAEQIDRLLCSTTAPHWDCIVCVLCVCVCVGGGGCVCGGGWVCVRVCDLLNQHLSNVYNIADQCYPMRRSVCVLLINTGRR